MVLIQKRFTKYIRLAVTTVILLAVLEKDSALGSESTQPSREQEVTDKSRLDQLFGDALVLIRQNKPEDACRLLEQANRLKPDSAPIHCNLGLAYQELGDLDRALAQYTEALKIDKDMPEAILNSAACYQSLGQTTLAVSSYEEYLRKFPTAPDVPVVLDSIQALKNLRPETDGVLPDYFTNLTERSRWPKGQNLQVFINKAPGISGFRDTFPGFLIQAFDAWMKSLGDKLSFTLVADKDSADIVCDWTDAPKNVSGGNSERGAAFTDQKNGLIRHASIVILTTPIVNLGQLSDHAVQKACLHEVGHVLGINGHSSNNRDVMYATVDSPTVQPALSGRDQATILKLYQE